MDLCLSGLEGFGCSGLTFMGLCFGWFMFGLGLGSVVVDFKVWGWELGRRV